MQDPHFKAGTHRRRIISRAQLADYAYLLAPGGILYTITDVPELGQWMREKVCAQPCSVACAMLHSHGVHPSSVFVACKNNVEQRVSVHS